MKLVGQIGDGGILVMAVCQIGYNDEIAEAIFQRPETGNIFIYMNGDNCKISTTKMVNTSTNEIVDITSPFENNKSLTNTENYDVGWKLYYRQSLDSSATDSTSQPQINVVPQGQITVTPQGQVKSLGVPGQ